MLKQIAQNLQKAVIYIITILLPQIVTKVVKKSGENAPLIHIHWSILWKYQTKAEHNVCPLYVIKSTTLTSNMDAFSKSLIV